LAGSRAQKILKPLGLETLVTNRAYQMARDPKWLMDSRGAASRARLLAMRDCEAGASGVIVGTGPSLLKTDLSAIGDRPTIGLNRLFYGFDTLGFRPDRLLCVNLMMLEQSAPEIEALDLDVVASWAGREHFSPGAAVTFIRTFDGKAFSRDLSDKVYIGSTVTYAALQLAHWLGWEEVTLLGIDHTYSLEAHEQVLAPHDTSVRRAPDRNHFLPDYFPAGQAWQLPDLGASEQAYREARHAFESDGRRVMDGTVGGALEVFDKVHWPLRNGADPLGKSLK